MHELSIAQSIVEIVRQNIPPNETRGVKSVKLRIGEMAGVVPDSLEFCFQAITADTSLQGAALIIDHVPLTSSCNECRTTFPNTDTVFVCPTCGGNDLTIMSGRELQVVEFELFDEPLETS